MKKIVYGWAFCIVMFAPVVIKAQSDSTKEDDKPQFKLGVYYNSNLNYYGRTDSLRSQGFFPLAELWFNKNFYINAAPIFVHNSVTSFDYAGTVASAGFRFNSNNKFAGNIYFVKPLYKDKSQLVQSALKGQFATTVTWLNKVLNLTAGADVKFSEQTDYGATAGLDHIFRYELPGSSVLVVDPSANLYAGTQQFTKSYYKQSSFLFFPGTEQTITEEVNNFNILSYEFSVPVIYAKEKWQLLFTPSYVIPQNLIVVAGRPDLSERGKKMFYATIGGKIIF
ncbi:MAG: hypothetical protein ABUL41_03565 [Chitinophagaceae bacterium]